MSESATTPRREATRQRLLDAAVQVFAEVGLDAASVEAICERAGYTRGAFYSNFDTKEELFLALVARVAGEHMAIVRARVAELNADDDIDVTPSTALQLVQQVLDVTPDDRVGVLLSSETRLHALRNPALAEAVLAQDAELFDGVAQIIGDIARAKRIELRLTPAEAARIMLMVWEGTSTRSLMAGLSPEETRRELNEQLARIAGLLIPEA